MYRNPVEDVDAVESVVKALTLALLLAICFLSALALFPNMPFMKILGYALHEKGLQRQKGAGQLVSSQEERALLVPLINR